MIEPRAPKFRWGQSVTAVDHLYNDGSVPGAADEALLVAAGGPGEIVQVGRHTESDTPVYLVDFGVAVIGCLEEEIAARPEAAA